MKLITGNGLYKFVLPQHIVSVSNYRDNGMPMTNMYYAVLINGEKLLCEGTAQAIYSEMVRELKEE